MVKNLLLVGLPGVGKTTIIRKASERLKEFDPIGFYTGEIREKGIRQGFRFTSLDGQEGVLAHVAIGGAKRVGKYGVDIAGFEALLKGLDLVGSPSKLVLLDEIGKMECFSFYFRGIVEALLGSDKVVVATIAAKGGGFIAEVKRRGDCEIVEVRRENRDQLPDELADRVKRLFVG